MLFAACAADEKVALAPPPPIERSEKVTRITEPVDADGRVDYLAAFDERMSKDVTSEDNFEVALRGVIGAKGLKEQIVTAYFDKLGIALPKDKPGCDLNEPSRFDLATPDTEESQFVWHAEDNPELADWLAKHRESLDQLVFQSRRPKLYIPPLWTDAMYVQLNREVRANAEKLASSNKLAERVAAATVRAVAPSPDSQHPPLSRPHYLDSIQQYRALSRILLTRANYSLGKDEPSAAVADILAVHRYSRTLAENGSFCYFAAAAFNNAACYAAHELVQSGKLDMASCKLYLQEMQNLSPFPDDVTLENLRWETLDAVYHMHQNRQAVLDQILQQTREVERDKIAAAFEQLDFAAMMRDVNLEFDLWNPVHRTDVPLNNAYYQSQAKARPSAQELMKQLPSVLKAEQGDRQETFAKWYYDMIMERSAITGFVKTSARQRAIHRLAVIGMAIEYHRLQHGRLPDSLDDLKEFNEAFMRDPYSGKPLRFKPSVPSWVLYSVGPDGVDNHAASERDMNTNRPMMSDFTPDMVFRVSRE